MTIIVLKSKVTCKTIYIGISSFFLMNGRELVKITGITHNYFHADIKRGCRLPAHDNILSHNISKESSVYHKNECAMLIPGLLSGMRVVDAITKQGDTPMPYEISSQDIPLLQYSASSASVQSIIPNQDVSGFRIIFAFI
jgi:hypothetical protein